MKISDKSVSSINELLEFYNKNLALDNDDAYILSLVDKLAKIFIAKIEAETDTSKRLEVDCRYDFDDKKAFSKFDKSCLNFWSGATIKLYKDEVVFIDRYGTIASFSDRLGLDYFKGQNIFTLLNELSDVPYFNKAKADAINVINQNIFASKLYKAVKERICDLSGIADAKLFEFKNKGILSYEANLLNKSPKFNPTVQNYTRVRSNR